MKINEFLGQVKSEFLKVEWPGLHEFLGSAAVCLLLVLFFTIFIGLVDRGIAFAARYIFTHGI